MRSRIIATALAVGIALVAAGGAAAGRHHAAAVRLAVLPLPKAALGTAGKHLSLAHDSGVVSDAEAANNTASALPSTFVKLGRVSGYTLDYGDVYGSGTSTVEIQTGVEKYKTAADAKKGLAFWKTDAVQKATILSQGGLAEIGGSFAAPRIGTARFGSAYTITVSSLSALSTADVKVADGSYVLDVSVAGSSVPTAKSLAGKLAKALDARLRLALAGKLRAKPVKLPAKRQAGAPAGGPDLSTVMLTASDFTGTATVVDSGYGVDPAAISDYAENWAPAGRFDALNQEVEWYPTSGDATFLAAYEQAVLNAVFAQTSPATPVDLSSVGDHAQGAIMSLDGGGSTIYLAVVTLTRGQATDLVAAASSTAIGASDVQSLAQAMASHLDAAVSG